MLKIILVPLDGTPSALRALPYAERLAQATRARLLLVAPAPARNARDGATVEAVKVQLEQVAAQLAARGVLVEPFYGDGPAAATIAAGLQHGADLVVMAAPGEPDLNHRAAGRMIDAVLRLAHLPLLLVPPACQATWPADRALRILIPLDDVDLARHVLGPVRELATALDADLLLLHIAAPPDYGLGSARQIERLARDLREAGLVVELHTVVGAPASALAQLVREQAADLLALGVAWPSVFAGRDTTQRALLQRLSIPALLVPLPEWQRPGRPQSRASAWR